MNDRFIRLSISLARLQKVIQRIKASGMSRIELKAGHTPRRRACTFRS